MKEKHTKSHCTPPNKNVTSGTSRKWWSQVNLFPNIQTKCQVWSRCIGFLLLWQRQPLHPPLWTIHQFDWWEFILLLTFFGSLSVYFFFVFFCSFYGSERIPAWRESCQTSDFSDVSSGNLFQNCDFDSSWGRGDVSKMAASVVYAVENIWAMASPVQPNVIKKKGRKRFCRLWNFTANFRMIERKGPFWFLFFFFFSNPWFLWSFWECWGKEKQWHPKKQKKQIPDGEQKTHCKTCFEWHNCHFAFFLSAKTGNRFCLEFEGPHLAIAQFCPLCAILCATWNQTHFPEPQKTNAACLSSLGRSRLFVQFGRSLHLRPRCCASRHKHSPFPLRPWVFFFLGFILCCMSLQCDICPT